VPGRAAEATRRSPGRLIMWVAAAVAVACTSGCSVFSSPPALSGMEKQIAKGERVSAATRAHPSRSAAGPAASPSPSATQSQVPGRQVTAIGDSVMAAGAMALADVLPGIYLDAKPDRQMPAGLTIVRNLAQTGRLRPVVVVGLGTNYIITTAQLNQLMQLLGPQRKLVLINTYVPDSWSKQVNATIAAYLHGHPNIVLADWFDTIKNRMYLLWPDQIHPELPGTYVYARMVDRAVQATRAITTPSTAAAVPPPKRLLSR
jgi:hypothetical protein